MSVLTRTFKLKVVDNEKDKDKTSEERQLIRNEKYKEIDRQLEYSRQILNKTVQNFMIEDSIVERQVNFNKRANKDYTKLQSQIKKLYTEIGKINKKLIKNVTPELKAELKDLEKELNETKEASKKIVSVMYKEAQEVCNTLLGGSENTRYTALQDEIDGNVWGDLVTSNSIRIAKSKMSDVKLEVRYGKMAAPTYRSGEILVRHLHSKKVTDIRMVEGKYFIRLIGDISFEIITNAKRQNSKEARTVLDNILYTQDNIYSKGLKIDSDHYHMCDSTIRKDKQGRLILALVVNIPDKEQGYLLPNRFVGVDLGVAIPAVCALSDNKYEKKFIGNIDDFLRVRQQIQQRKLNISKQLAFTGGGHGRSKKMKPLDKSRLSERNFVKTYNHKVSKAVVEFALKNQASVIKLEALDFSDKKKGSEDEKNSYIKKILRNWSYYELQQFITYKAKVEGIKVVMVDPYMTSQTCSECGNCEKGQRTSQQDFHCKQCGHKSNADFNAARNIAKAEK